MNCSERATRPIAYYRQAVLRGRRSFDVLAWFVAAAVMLQSKATSEEPLAVTVSAPLGTAALSTPADKQAATDSSKGLDLFKQHVHGILVDKCVKCHGGQKIESDFNLATREGLLKGGAYGIDVVAGNADESPMIRFLEHAEEPHMPESEPKLAAESIAMITRWIDAGAPYSAPLVKEGALVGHSEVTDADRQFWSFRALSEVDVPAVKDASWVRTPIDHFVLARLEKAGIRPNAAADRRQLIRRTYLDLIGLPPTPAEVEVFVSDPAPDAYEQLIDRLLESPHYGERWARHWLDLARFAESHGYEQDYNRPYAYHYRDFVIRALNDDMPYDQFVRWQIAGDEFAPDDPQAWMATGFLAAGTHATQITANQAEKERYDELDDQVATVGTAILGLTVGCARCHDHKYDPIPSRDYYRMIATFTTTVRSDFPIVLDAADYRKKRAAYEAKLKPLLARRDAAERRAVDSFVDGLLGRSPATKFGVGFLPAELKAIGLLGIVGWVRCNEPESRAVADFARSKPQPRTVTALVCSEGVPAIRLHTQGPDFYTKSYILKRGDLSQKTEEATPGFLQVLDRAGDDGARWRESPAADSRTPYRRRALANWLTDVDDGAGSLAARVIVNRLWQHHFGRGIVATPSDFGSQGEPPTHPELLEWMANELLRNKWQLKPLHRLIMTSAVYVENAESDSQRANLDADNNLLWRHTRRRLEAETIRDAMLSVSGMLDETMFGPGTLDEGQRRRSIYFTIKRSRMTPILRLFDGPDALQGLGQRSSTTVAPQALWLLNNPQVSNFAAALAERLRLAWDISPEEGIQEAYKVVLGRAPNGGELSDVKEFLARDKSASATDTTQRESEFSRFTIFCHALLSMNEFIYVE